MHKIIAFLKSLFTGHTADTALAGLTKTVAALEAAADNHAAIMDDAHDKAARFVVKALANRDLSQKAEKAATALKGLIGE